MVFKKGNTPWNKGLSANPNDPNYDPRVLDYTTKSGKTIGEQLRNGERDVWNKGETKYTHPSVASMSKKLTGRISPLRGVPRSKKTKAKISEALKGRIISDGWKNKMIKTKLELNLEAWNKGLTRDTDIRVDKYAKKLENRKISKTTRQKLRKAIVRRRGKYPKTDTSIERALHKKLKRKNIIYEKDKPLLDLTRVDVFIPPNICIYADGNYWHNYPHGLKKDKRQNKKLKEEGYVVLRFWGSEIRENLNGCINTIINTIEKNGG